MPVLHRILALSVILASTSATSADGLLPLAQQRSALVMADAEPCGPVGDFQIESAEDFEPFAATLSDVQLCEKFGAIALATQESLIEPAMLSASGSTSAETIVPPDIFEFVLAYSDSSYDVEFEVASTIRVRITGQLSASAAAELPPSYSAQAHVSLREGFEELFTQQVVGLLNEGPMQEVVDASLILEPGAYRFIAACDTAITDAFPTTGQTSAAYEAALRLFNIVDLNVDGVVDAFDLALLLGSWGPCADCDDCPADLDDDCAVGPADLAILLGNWG